MSVSQRGSGACALSLAPVIAGAPISSIMSTAKPTAKPTANPDSDTNAKEQLGGAIRSIKQCLGSNTDLLSASCKTAINLLAAKAAAEKAELDAAAGTTARRQLQVVAVDLSPLVEAADTLDPAAPPNSARGLGAPLALALIVLTLNR